MRNQLIIHLYLKKDVLKRDGTTPVMARISLNAERVQITTNVSVVPDEWDGNAQRITGRDVSARCRNNEIDKFKSSVWNAYRELRRMDIEPTPSDIRDLMSGVKKFRISFLDLWEKHIEDLRRLAEADRISRKTLSRYVLTYKRLKEFLKSEYRAEDMDCRKIKVSFIEDFETYLLTVCKLSRNTAAKPLKYVKMIIRKAHELGIIQNNPLNGFKIKMEKTDRGFLTEDELLKISLQEMPSKPLEVVRDAFLFSCFTGLSFCDLCELTMNDVREIGKGNFWIIVKRNKTGVVSKIRLLSAPLRILERYRKEDTSLPVFPLQSNQKVNVYLKMIAGFCGIEQRVTFHLARHTFATTVTLEKGVPIETVSKMLGHSDIRTTQIYARVTRKKIETDMNILETKLQKFG